MTGVQTCALPIYVPPAFVLLAGIAILLPVIMKLFRYRKRELAVVAVVLAAGLCIDRATISAHPQLSAKERGRKVYIAEGCINCHSQYVRPNSADVPMWGPVQTVSELRREQPPLIGNRRQGPDLAEVGSRRSPLWFKAHLYAPSALSHGSFMPSYSYLFHDGRGADLVTYLESLQTSGVTEQRIATARWSASEAAVDPSEGERLFLQHCATCHSDNGYVRNRWQQDFRRLPPDLRTGPFLHFAPAGSIADRAGRIEKIVKFGIHGTDMPGHEYLTDRQTASISRWVAHEIAQY